MAVPTVGVVTSRQHQQQQPPTTPSRRRKGAIASRYLEAIQCGGTETTAATSAPYGFHARELLRGFNDGRSSSSLSSSRSRNHGRSRAGSNSTSSNASGSLGFGCSGAGSEAVSASSASSPSPLPSLPNPFRSASSPGIPRSPQKTALPKASVYEKITAAGKAADCSRSILTASTAMMQDTDPSYSYDDSMSSNSNSNSSASQSPLPKKHSPPRRRTRGRSRTPNEGGTNSSHRERERERRNSWNSRGSRSPSRGTQRGHDSSIRENKNDYNQNQNQNHSQVEEAEGAFINAAVLCEDDENDRLEPQHASLSSSSTESYLHLPGTQTTAPLSASLPSSAPSTPKSRHHHHHHHHPQTSDSPNNATGRRPYQHPALAAAAAISPRTPPNFQSESDYYDNRTTPYGAHISIMGIDNDGESSTVISQEEASAPADADASSSAHASTNVSPSVSATPHSHEKDDANPERGRTKIPTTSPRRPSGSPGPQPKSPGDTRLQWRIRQVREQQRLQRRLQQQHEQLRFQLQRSHSQSLQQQQLQLHEKHIPNPSEAGAPTEIMTNGTTRNKIPYPLSRTSRTLPSNLNGGSGKHNHNHNNDLLSRVRNRFQSDDEDEVLLPSLLDASSSSVSSASLSLTRGGHSPTEAPSSAVAAALPLPIGGLTKNDNNNAASTVLSTATKSSKLAQHVESARKMQSILSSSCGSETTASASLDTNHNVSSLNAEPGGGSETGTEGLTKRLAAAAVEASAEAATRRSGSSPSTSTSTSLRPPGMASLLGPSGRTEDGDRDADSSNGDDLPVPVPQQQQQQQRGTGGGLLRRPSGAQVAMLAAQYRKGNLTARGAQPQPHAPPQQEVRQQPPPSQQELRQQPERETETTENNDSELADSALNWSYSQSTTNFLAADSVVQTPGSQSTTRRLWNSSLNMSYSNSTLTNQVVTPVSQSTMREPGSNPNHPTLDMSYTQSTSKVVPDPILSLSYSQSTAANANASGNSALHTPSSQATIRHPMPNLPQAPRLRVEQHRKSSPNQPSAAPREEETETEIETDCHRVLQDNESDESSLPEYESYDSDDEENRGEEDSRGGKTCSNRAQEFVSYNERSSPNTADVFQPRGRSPSSLKKTTSTRKQDSSMETETSKRQQARSLSRGRDRRGKSPIQPLFSSERLDESNNTLSRMRASSLRSRSLGRTITKSMTLSPLTSPSSSPHCSSRPFARPGQSRPGVDPGNKPPLRRTKSLSQPHERKLFAASASPSTQAMRASSKERQSRAKQSVLREKRAQRGDDDEEELVHILEQRNRHDHASFECERENERETERRSSGTPSLRESRSKTPPTSMAESTVARNPRLRDASPGWRQEPPPARRSSMDSTTSSFRKGSSKDLQSIKDKIRAYNLKKSPRSVRSFNPAESLRVPSSITQWDTVYSSSSRSTDSLEPSSRSRSGHSRRSLSRQAEEEKKEDDGIPRGAYAPASSEMGTLRDKLQRRFVEAQYFGEPVNNDSATTTTTNDEFSVQSLREHFERQSADRENGVEEDDDPSVRSLREMFEPASNKGQNGEAVSSLRARFEPKPRASRMSFASALNDRGRRMPLFKPVHSRLNDWSVRHLSGRNPCPSPRGAESKCWAETPYNSYRASHTRGEETDSCGRDDLVAPRIPRSHPKPKEGTRNQRVHVHDLTKTNTSTDSEFSDAVTLDPSYAEVSLLSNPQLPKAPGVGNDSEGELSRKDTKESSTDSEFSDAVTLDPSYAEVSLLTNPSPIRITRVTENIPAVLKSDNHRIPGAHWTAQGKTRSNAATQELTRKDTKESSTDSEFSDAVTLDPSYAEVSLLSNPSPIRSLPSSGNEPDQASDVSTSLLLNMAKRVPEIDDAMKTSGVPKSSRMLLHGNRGNLGSSSDDLESSYEDETSESSANCSEDSPVADSVPRYRTLQNPSNLLSSSKAESQSHQIVSIPVCDPGFESSEGQYRSTDDYSHANRDSLHRSSRLQDNSRMADDSSGRSNGSMSTSGDGVESPYKSPRSIGTAQTPLGPFIPSIESPSEQVFESSSRSSRSGSSPLVSMNSSNRSSHSINSSRQAFGALERSGRSPERSYRDMQRSRSSRSADRFYGEIQPLNRLNTSEDGIGQVHDSSESTGRSTDKTRAVVDMSILRSPDSQAPPTLSFKDKPRHWPIQQQHEQPASATQLRRPSMEKDHDPSHEEQRSPNNVSNAIDPMGLRATPPGSKPESVPPMPSPFDENYAAIMESRHKMLLSRQRTLLNRRANRGKLQNFQQQHQQQQKKHPPGFFGKTNPISPSRGNVYVGLSDDEEEAIHHPKGGSDYEEEVIHHPKGIEPNAGVNSGSNHSRGLDHSRRPNGFWSGNERASYGLLPDPQDGFKHWERRQKTSGSHCSPHHRAATPVVQNSGEEHATASRRVTSILSRIRPAFHFGTSLSTSTSPSSSLSSQNRNENKRDSQKQAVLDRLSAVRAARMRQNYADGNDRKNAAGNGTSCQTTLDTIHDSTALNLDDTRPLVSTPGYRYYPHHETLMDFSPRVRDDDQSFATNESNAQEYAAKLAVD